MSFFWGGHVEFSKSAILNFCLLHLCEKSSPFIWGIIFFCNMDGFSRILKKKGGGISCKNIENWQSWKTRRPFWIFWVGHFELASFQWKTQDFHMRYHFFLHYGWFFQNLGKEPVRTFMHTTVYSFYDSYQEQSIKFECSFGKNFNFMCIYTVNIYRYKAIGATSSVIMYTGKCISPCLKIL